MLIALLVMLLSEPGEPIVFAVVGDFKSQSECVQFIAKADVPDEMRRRLSCLPVVKPVEA